MISIMEQIKEKLKTAQMRKENTKRERKKRNE